MSKVFYDHLLFLDEVFVEIETLEIPKSEKKQLKDLIDETAHHQVLTFILDTLPREHHEEFLSRFHTAPFDVTLVVYLAQKSGKNMHQELATLGEKIRKDFKKDLKKHKKKRS
jgi:hypothetical protein